MHEMEVKRLIKKPKTKTKKITSNKMATYVKPTSNMVYLFHMKTCPHCIAMENEWKRAKEFDYPKIKNITEIEREFVHSLKYPELKDINAFPLIIAFDNNGKKYEYNGYRTKDELAKFIERYG
jgi:thioredoxin-related protein